MRAPYRQPRAKMAAQSKSWQKITKSLEQMAVSLHGGLRTTSINVKRYKIVLAFKKRVVIFKVICAASRETISDHKTVAEAKVAVRRYEAADANRGRASYPGDMS